MSKRNGTIGMKTRGGTIRLFWSLAAGAVLAGTICDVHAEDQSELKLEAPKDQVMVGGKTGGFYWVAKPLKQQYDKLRARVQSLRAEIVGGEIGSSLEAADQIEALQAELSSVREQIETTKTFIAVGQIATKTETTQFDLGPEKLLFLNGISAVHLVGWDEPGVKCVLEKTVIGPRDQSLDAHLAAIRLVHRLGPANAVVGRAAEEARADEENFLASDAGQKLPPEQLQARHALVEKISAGQTCFRPFQGKAIDLVELEGLSGQQGNRSLTYEIRSTGGKGPRSLGSMWQRHASLTVYVPAGIVIGVRGGLGGFEADGVKSPLILRGEGDRDFDSHSHIKDHDGSLTVENIALDMLENVHGNVSITIGAQMENSFTHHEQGYRRMGCEPPAVYSYQNIDGDFTALLLRTNLSLSGVNGRVDVSNEFGDTRFVVRKPLSAARHRVVSESGNITLQLAGNALKGAPLLAATECGTVRVAEGVPPLAEENFNCWPGAGLIRRGYRGFASKDPAADDSPFGRLRRFEHLATGDESTPGFDVLSRAGTVQIEPVGE